MKTILVLIDFSESSVNAARYAVKLAGSFPGCRVIIYHAFVYTPVYSEEQRSIPLSVEDFSEENMGRLRDLRVYLQCLTAEGRNIVCKTDQSPLIDGVTAIAKHEQADLIVAGGKARPGENGSFFGSSTLDLLHALPFPLLVIPCDAVFDPLQRAVFACELKEVERIPVEHLLCITHGLDSKLFALNVGHTAPGYLDPASLQQHEKLQVLMKDLQPEYHQVINPDVREGILQFTRERRANLVIVIHKKHGFFYDLFQGSVTRKLAMRLSAPLLVLKEKTLMATA